MKKIVIILLLGLSILVSYIFFQRHAELPVEKSEPVVEQIAEDEQAIMAREASEATNLKKMQEKYAHLKEARKELTLTLSRLGSRLRKVKFSPEQASDIGKLMRKANYALKNPKLLGAFSSVDQIEQDLEKIQSFQGKLEGVRQLLDDMKENKQ